MRIAIVGSRDIRISDSDIERYVSVSDEIVSGGAVGVDSFAADYARRNNIKLTELLPEYNIYGRAAPIVRNMAIYNKWDNNNS